jgi:5-carboxymethyl-2-hydroxymuconic-semialdehyde dehydrogenase
MAGFEDNQKKANVYLERFRSDGVKNQIAGEAVAAASGTTFETISPVDLQPLATVATPRTSVGQPRRPKRPFRNGPP